MGRMPQGTLSLGIIVRSRGLDGQPVFFWDLSLGFVTFDVGGCRYIGLLVACAGKYVSGGYV